MWCENLSDFLFCHCDSFLLEGWVGWNFPISRIQDANMFFCDGIFLKAIKYCNCRYHGKNWPLARKRRWLSRRSWRRVCLSTSPGVSATHALAFATIVNVQQASTTQPISIPIYHCLPVTYFFSKTRSSQPLGSSPSVKTREKEKNISPKSSKLQNDFRNGLWLTSFRHTKWHHGTSHPLHSRHMRSWRSRFQILVARSGPQQVGWRGWRKLEEFFDYERLSHFIA